MQGPAAQSGTRREVGNWSCPAVNQVRECRSAPALAQGKHASYQAAIRGQFVHVGVDMNGAHPHRSIPSILPPPSKNYQLTIFKPSIAKFLIAASFVTRVTPSASA
jgi:hypothetical protein